MFRHFSIFCFVYLFLAIAPNCPLVYAQQSILLHAEQKQYSFEGRAQYCIIDSAQTLVYAHNIPKTQWKSFPTTAPSLGYLNDKAVWVRLAFTRTIGAPNDWVLQLDYSSTELLDAYILDTLGRTIKTYETGRLRPFASRGEIQHVAFAFPLSLAPNETQEVYLKIAGNNPVMLPLYVMRQAQVQADNLNDTLYYGLYFGALLVMILYNIFVFIGLRDLNYLYYVLTIVFTVFTFAGVSGYAYKYVLTDFIWMNAYLTRISMGFIVLTTSVFARSFLDTARYAPWIDKALLTTAVLSVLAIGLVITDVRVSATNTLVSIQTVLLLTAGIVCWRRGNRFARFYVIAWAAYIIGGIAITLRNAGVVPMTFFTTHGAEIGSVLEVVLISLALSDRYRVIRRERQELMAEKSRMLEEYSHDLENQVKERTASLAETNEELQQLNEELGSTLETVESQKNDLEQQKVELKHAYDNIQASISYAKRIQQAKLPQREHVQAVFPESFIFFKPRDVVSGDFYWFAEMGNKVFIAAADCTGHGVPGALMSMIGTEILNDVVLRRGATEPANILRLLHEGVRETLRQRETQNRDGMDIALCTFEADTKTLTFAGAYSPLLYVQQGAIFRIKGDNAPIGGRQRENKRFFTQHSLVIDQPTTVYLFSDGYADQFGGADGRKFMAKHFRNTLLEMQHLSMSDQAEVLDQTLAAWQNYRPEYPEKQVDDILVIGFKIG